MERPANKALEVERLLSRSLPSEFKGRTFAVGGFVRDLILGLEPKDLDVVVDIEGGAERLAVALHSIHSDSTFQPRRMGAHYPIWQLVFNKDITIGTDTFEVEGAEVEISETMIEAYPDEDSRQRTVRFGTLDDDVRRRDFTINMLMRDLSDGRIIDLSETSSLDIERGVIRSHPKVDSDIMFSEDPLRLLRAIRFAVCLGDTTGRGWRIPLSMLRSMRRNAGRIRIVSMERVNAELRRMLATTCFWRALELMRITGLLENILPEIHAMIGCSQPKEFHAEGDVYDHTIMALKNSRPGILDQLAVMLHDVGKPATRTVEDGAIHFYKHDWVGGDMAESLLRKLKFDNRIVDDVSYVVRNHMRPHTLDGASKKSLRKFLREMTATLVQPILGVAEADELGSKPYLGFIPKLRERLFDPELHKFPVRRTPILDGHEIMTALNVKPGPFIGEVGNWLMEAEDEYAAMGRVFTKDEAVYLIKKEWGGHE